MGALQRITGGLKKIATDLWGYWKPIDAADTNSKALRRLRPSLISGRSELTSWDRDTVNARADYLVTNDALGQGIDNRLTRYVIGNGLKLESKINHKAAGLTEVQAKELQKQFEEDFDQWASSEDSNIYREQTFYESQKEAYAFAFRYGEIFFNIPHSAQESPEIEESLRHQLIDPNRVSNPGRRPDRDSLVSGVELDENGMMVLGYYITRKHPGDLTDVHGAVTWDRHDAWDQEGQRLIFHWKYRKTKIDSLRGLSAFTAIIENVFNLKQYRGAELLAAIQQANLIYAIFSDEESSPFDDLKKEQYLPFSLKDHERAINSSTYLDLSEEDRVEMFQPTRPFGNYGPYTDEIRREICFAIGIPQQVLEMLFDASFSASKAAINQFREFVEVERWGTGNKYCRPHFVRFVDEGVMTGRYKIPGYFENKRIRNAVTMSSWRGKAISEIDESKAAAAAKIRKESGLTSNQYEREKMGLDNDRIEQQVQEENDNGVQANIVGP